MRISFFNKVSYKKFDFPARYYDEQKSDFERRMNKWKEVDPEKSTEFNKENFRDDLRRTWSKSRVSNSTFNYRYTNFRRMLVLAAIVVALVLLISYLGNKYLT